MPSFQTRDGLRIPAQLVARPGLEVQPDFGAIGVLRDRAFEPLVSLLLGAVQTMLDDAVRGVAEGKVRVDQDRCKRPDFARVLPSPGGKSSTTRPRKHIFGACAIPGTKSHSLNCLTTRSPR
jgi:hypothetical protein